MGKWAKTTLAKIQQTHIKDPKSLYRKLHNSKVRYRNFLYGR